MIRTINNKTKSNCVNTTTNEINRVKFQKVNTVNPMSSYMSNVKKDEMSLKKWQRFAGVTERFYLGDDESEIAENEKVYGFGSSPDSWDCKDELFNTRHSSFDNTSDNEMQTFFVMSSEDEDNYVNKTNVDKTKKKIHDLFVLDEDSGMGSGSAPNSATDDEEFSNNKVSKLTLLRTHDTGKVNNIHHNGRKLKKLCFQDFYKMNDDYLGSGAYACVRTAVSLSSGKEFAVKLVDKREPGHTRSRIFREVEIFKLCKNHANIVQLIEWFEDDVYFYMVFEKMRGGPLLHHIQRKVCFTEQEASLVTRDIAAALKFLHDRGIAHRDVKPENILCTEPNRVSPVKLCDLDLASKPTLYDKKVKKYSMLSVNYLSPNCDKKKENITFTKNSSLLQASSISSVLPVVNSEPDLVSPVGSAEFMAPEVVDAFVGESLKYDKRCDMWSLGVIVYIMLCGYPPFYGECERKNCGWDQGQTCSDCQESLFYRIQLGEFDFPEEEWGNISDEAKDLISHLLVRNVRERYTADDVLKHSWVAHGAPSTPLQTPSNLFRNDSARDMHQMNQVFQVYQHFNSPSF